MSAIEILPSIIVSKAKIYPDGLNESEVFELFCAENILKNHDLNIDDLEGGIVDGQDDNGIDSVYTFVNGTLVDDQTDFSVFKQPVSIDLYVIQSKWSSNAKEAPVDKLTSNLLKFVDLSNDLSDFANIASPALLEKFELYRQAFESLTPQFPKVSMTVCYCVSKSADNIKAKDKASYLEGELYKHCLQGSANVEIFGAEQLYELASSQSRFVRELTIAPGPISSDKSFIALTTLADYRNFVDDNDYPLERLFEFNVRDYEGDKIQVNSAIASTLKDKKSGVDFWWLNNGITIIASKASPAFKKLTLENPLVVNGLQTSHVIHANVAADSDDQRQVLIRVIEVEDEDQRDQIIQATNSQTGIKKASLRATDPMQRKIEDYLAQFGIFYERRKNYYKNKGKKAADIISIDRLTASLLACLRSKPADARARYSNVFKDDNEYDEIFGENNVPFQVYKNVSVIYKKVDDYLRKSKKAEESKYKHNLRYYIMLYVVWYLARTKQLNNQIVAQIPITKIDDALLDNVFGKVKSEFVKLGDTDTVAKGNKLKPALEKVWSDSKDVLPK